MEVWTSFLATSLDVELFSIVLLFDVSSTFSFWLEVWTSFFATSIDVKLFSIVLLVVSTTFSFWLFWATFSSNSAKRLCESWICSEIISFSDSLELDSNFCFNSAWYWFSRSVSFVLRSFSFVIFWIRAISCSYFPSVVEVKTVSFSTISLIKLSGWSLLLGTLFTSWKDFLSSARKSILLSISLFSAYASCSFSSFVKLNWDSAFNSWTRFKFLFNCFISVCIRSCSFLFFSVFNFCWVVEIWFFSSLICLTCSAIWDSKFIFSSVIWDSFCFSNFSLSSNRLSRNWLSSFFLLEIIAFASS